MAIMAKELQFKKTSPIIRRIYDDCGDFQWARELLMNSMEAEATKVEFGIEWQAVEQLGIYRRIISDNGCGMTAQELADFFSFFGEGSKDTTGMHTNFGIGGKVSTLPWNPEGLVVISYKNSVPSMIWIQERDEAFTPIDFLLKDETKLIINPETDIDWVEWKNRGHYDDIDWSQVAPDWVRENGTCVILLGDQNSKDTVSGDPNNPKESNNKGLSRYLNTRFWNLSDIEVRVAELNYENKSEWPQNRDETKGKINNRKIEGVRYHLEYQFRETKSDRGSLKDAGTVHLIDGRLAVDWYLWEGERPKVRDFAQKNGFIAVKVGAEIFEPSSHISHFRRFGISEAKIRERLTIILRPKLKGTVGDDPQWGIRQSNDRNRLSFSSRDQKSESIPYHDWGQLFLQNMPQPVQDAISEIRHEASGTLDESFRDRLPAIFANRWKETIETPSSSGEEGTGDSGDDLVKPENDNPPPPPRLEPVIPRPPAPTPPEESTASTGDDPQKTKQKKTDRGFPKFTYVSKDEFEKEWSIGRWVKGLPGHPPEVQLNQDSKVILDAIRYQQERNSPELEEEVKKIVMNVFGEIAVAKMAHLQELSKHGKISTEELDEEYRSETAITTALMGIFAEEFAIEARIKQMLGKSSGN